MRVGVNNYGFLCLYFKQESTAKRIYDVIESKGIKQYYPEGDFVERVASAIKSYINYDSYLQLSDSDKGLFASDVATTLMEKVTKVDIKLFKKSPRFQESLLSDLPETGVLQTAVVSALYKAVQQKHTRDQTGSLPIGGQGTVDVRIPARVDGVSVRVFRK